MDAQRGSRPVLLQLEDQLENGWEQQRDGRHRNGDCILEME